MRQRWRNAAWLLGQMDILEKGSGKLGLYHTPAMRRTCKHCKFAIYFCNQIRPCARVGKVGSSIVCRPLVLISCLSMSPHAVSRPKSPPSKGIIPTIYISQLAMSYVRRLSTRAAKWYNPTLPLHFLKSVV